MTNTPNQYWMGDFDAVFPRFTKLPAGAAEIVADRWNTYTVDGTGGVHYAEHFRGMILTPEVALRDMDAADYTLSPGGGIWESCSPPYTGAAHLGCLVARPATVGAGAYNSSITSRHNLPERPSLTLSLVRADAPAGYAAGEQRFVFAFGGGWALTFGGTSIPVLSYGGSEVARAAQVNFDQDYYTRPLLRVEIYNLFGRLYLIGLTTDPWIIREAGNLPAAVWSMSCNGGAYAVNVTPHRYATGGTFYTPYLTFSDAYDVTEMFTTVQPAAPAGTSVSVGVQAGTGNTRRLAVTLAGDGWHTPVVQVFSGFWLPETVAPDGDLIEVTDWVLSAKESKPFDVRASRCEVTCTLFPLPDSGALLAAVGELRGHHAFRYTSGIPGQAGVRRMTGVIKTRTAVNAASREITLTALDRWTLLQEFKLFGFPCVAGLTVQSALELLFQWCGYQSSEILFHDLPGVLDSPFDTDGDPAWLPANGSSAAELCEQICNTQHLYPYHDADGRIDITNIFPALPGTLYTTAPGTAQSVGLVSFSREVELRGVENGVIVEGRDADGRPIFASRWDRDSLFTPGSDQYLGYPAPRYVRDENITTLEGAGLRCLHEWAERAHGRPAVQLTHEHPDSTLCLLLPRQYITVADTVTGETSGRLFRVESVETTMEHRRNVATVTSVEVEAE